MADLNQKIGFDASAAIEEIVKLEKALTGLSTTTAGAGDSLKKFNVKNVRKSALSADVAIKKLRDSFKKTGKEGAESGKKITLSWETLKRVFVTQIFVRALSQLRDGFKAAVGEAIEFERRIAEITTIDTRTFGEAAKEVRALSDAFNRPLGEVGEGLYQTVSNQVKGLNTQLILQSQALKFSTITGTESAASIGLITGSINATGRSFNEAGIVAARFFKTIELGKVRGEELASSFGRVSRLGEQAGVTMEELQASIATITISGVKAAEEVLYSQPQSVREHFEQHLFFAVE